MCGYLARASACGGAPPSMLNVLARLPCSTLARAPVTEVRCRCASESQELGAAAGSSPPSACWRARKRRWSSSGLSATRSAA